MLSQIPVEASDHLMLPYPRRSLSRVDSTLVLGLRGKTWRRVQVEVSADEADYRRAAASAAVSLTVDAAVASVNDWLAAIEGLGR